MTQNITQKIAKIREDDSKRALLDDCANKLKSAAGISIHDQQRDFKEKIPENVVNFLDSHVNDVIRLLGGGAIDFQKSRAPTDQEVQLVLSGMLQAPWAQADKEIFQATIAQTLETLELGKPLNSKEIEEAINALSQQGPEKPPPIMNLDTIAAATHNHRDQSLG